MALDVDAPDIAVVVDADAMVGDDHVVTPGLEHLSALVELDDRVRAAIEYPDVVVAVDGDAGAFAEVPALGELSPVFDYFVLLHKVVHL